MKGPVEIIKNKAMDKVDQPKETRFPGKTWPQVCAILSGKFLHSASILFINSVINLIRSTFSANQQLRNFSP